MIKRILTAGGIVLFAFMIPLAVLYIISTPYGEKKVRSYIENTLAGTLGLDVELLSFETNVVSRVRIGGIRLSSVISGARQEILTSGNIDISYSIKNLISLSPRIESATIDSLTINAFRDSSGFNFPMEGISASRKNKNSSFKFSIGSLTVDHSSLSLDDSVIDLDILAENIYFDLRDNYDDFSFQLHSNDFDMHYHGSEVPIGSLSLSGSIANEMFTFDELSIEMPDMICEMEGSIDLSQSPAGVDAEIHLSGEADGLNSVLRHLAESEFIPQSGTVDVVLIASGSVKSPSIKYSADVNNLSIAELLFESIAIRGSIDNRQINLDSCLVSVFNGEIRGSGRMSADSLMNHSFDLEIAKIDMASLWNVFHENPSPYSGSIDGSIVTSGPLKNPFDCSVKGDIALQYLQLLKKKIDDFNVTLSFAEKRLLLAADQPGTAFSSDISFVDNRLKGGFGFSTNNPEFFTGFANIFDLKGALDIEGELSGDLQHPSLQANFTGHDILYRTLTLDSIHGGLNYENGQIFIRESTFGGEIHSFEDLAKTFDISGVSGSGYYNGSLNGDIRDLTGAFYFSLREPEYKGYRFDTVEANISLRENSVIIENALITILPLKVAVLGAYDIAEKKGELNIGYENSRTNNESLDADAIGGHEQREKATDSVMNLQWSHDQNGILKIISTGTNIQLGDLASISEDSLSVSGLMDYHFDFNGTLSHPTATLNAQFRNPVFNGIFFDSLDGSFRITPDRLYLDNMNIVAAGGKSMSQGWISMGEGSYPSFGGKSDFEFTSQGSNLLLQLIRQRLPEKLSIRGSSDHVLTMRGTLKAPVIKGNVSFHDAVLSANRDSLAIFFDLKASLADSSFVVESAEGLFIGIPFSLKGDVVTRNWEEFTSRLFISMNGNEVFSGNGNFDRSGLRYQASIVNFNLSALDTMLPGILAPKGTARSRLSIVGDYADPEIHGSLEIEDVSFSSPHFSSPVSNGFAKVRFDRKSVILDSLYASLGKGYVSATGTAAIEGRSLSSLDIMSVAYNLNFDRPKEYRLLVDKAVLRCNKQNAYYNIDGEIDLGKSRFIKTFDPKTLIPFMKKIERPNQEPSIWATQVRLNVIIHNNKDLWIDNNLAHLSLQTNLGLVGSLARPNITGRLAVDEGYLIYLDKKFKIERGILDFVDPVSVNPIVDLNAVSTLKKYQSMSGIPYTVTLNVSGELDDTALSLTSSPPLDKQDIITLLTFGVTRSQLSGNTKTSDNTSLGAVLQERAVQLSSRKLSGYITQRVSSLVGIDDISLEGNLFSQDKAAGPQLIASEQINDRVGITYSTAVGHMNEQRIRLDYMLNKRFFVEGETDQRGRSSLDLKYKIKFR